MQSKAKTVREYVSALPEDRRIAVEALRKVIKKNLDKNFEEGMQYGMIGYYLPHSKYPAGYHCDPKQPLPFASIASQKNHIGIYLFCLYCEPGEPERFAEEWKATGNKLDMGKSCIRAKKLEAIPLSVVGRAIKRITAKKFVASYEASLEGGSTKRATQKPVAAKKPVKKKVAKKKVAKKAMTRVGQRTTGKAKAKVVKKVVRKQAKARTRKAAGRG